MVFPLVEPPFPVPSLTMELAEPLLTRQTDISIELQQGEQDLLIGMGDVGVGRVITIARHTDLLLDGSLVHQGDLTGIDVNGHIRLLVGETLTGLFISGG